MRRNVILILALMMAVGFSQNYTSCIDTLNQQQNFSIIVNGNNTNISVATACQYGCDQKLGQCRTIDANYGVIVTATFIFFIVMVFWLSNHFKPREEEMDYSKIGLSFLFLVFGMVLTLGLLLYVGSIGAGYVSSFITDSSNMILGVGNIWGVLIGVFIFFIAIFFLNGIVKNYIMRDRRRE